MKIKKVILFLVICTLLSVGSFDAAQYPAAYLSEEEALVTSFESTGAEVMESTISCWVKLDDKFTGYKQLKQQMDGIIGALKLENVMVVKDEGEDDDLCKLVIYGTKANKAYNIALESLKQDTGGETYIVFDIFIDKDYKELKAERQKITELLGRAEDEINFSSCIVGTYKGRLKEKDAERKSELALQSINAKPVEGIEDDGMKSISAFSTNVGEYVVSDRQRINVQLAIRYSTYDDKTYIWIGTPLIPMGY